MIMNVFFIQTILAAPEDVDKWMNILFVVVLAVFWALRGLFRDKIKESETKSGPKAKEQPTRKTVQRSSERARALWEQFLEQTRQPSESPSQKAERSGVPHQPQIVASKSDVRKGSTVSKQSVIVKTPEQPLKPKQTVVPSLNVPPSKSDIPELFLDTQILPESSIKTVENVSEDDYISENLLDYADPEGLTKAVLHYEILGKPLSLRNPSDSF
jgi:hypothetical protein